MKQIICLSLGVLVCASSGFSQEGVTRQVQALKTAMDSFRTSTAQQISDMADDISNLESTLTSFETCAGKRMVFIDDTTAGDDDGCAAPLNGGGFDLMSTSDLTRGDEDVRMHRGRMYVERPGAYSDDCVGREIPNASLYHTINGVFTQRQASPRACEEGITSSYTSVLAKFGSTWHKIAHHGDCAGGATKEFTIELSKDRTSSYVSSKMTTVNNSTIRGGHNLSLESKSHISAPWTGDIALCTRDRYDAIGSLNLLMAK